jgi:hypothetical protein
MRDPKRIPEFLGRIRRLWETYPDLRFGQLLLNVINADNITSFYYMEDNKLIEILEKEYFDAENFGGETVEDNKPSI